MDNPEKSATVSTYDTGQRQTKQKTKHRKLKDEQQENAGHQYTQTYTQNTIRHELSYKQLEAKSNQTSFYVEIVTDITTRN